MLSLPRSARAGGRPVVFTIRRIGKSVDHDLQIAAGLRSGMTGTVNKWTELRLRWAIVGAKALTDADTGESVDFAATADERFPELRRIAAPEVFDALGDLDCILILAVAARNMPVVKAESLANELRVLIDGGALADAVAKVEAAAKAGEEALAGKS